MGEGGEGGGNSSSEANKIFPAAFPSQLPKNPAENYVNCQLLKF